MELFKPRLKEVMKFIRVIRSLEKRFPKRQSCLLIVQTDCPVTTLPRENQYFYIEL